jgi:small conductance mechanosensitive channel
LGLIYITSLSIAQTSIPSTETKSTSITFKDTSSLFTHLSNLANFTERLPSQWIWLDGHRLFKVTALEDYLPARVQKIESNLAVISNAYFQSNSNDLRVKVVPVNGSSTIEVNEQYLLTVTELDAKLLGINTATWAKQLSQTLERELIRAKQERQPQFLKRQSAIAVGIMFVVIVINWLLLKFRWRINPDKNKTARQTKIGSTVIPVVNTRYSGVQLKANLS